jgi:hypothetical protein
MVKGISSYLKARNDEKSSPSRQHLIVDPQYLSSFTVEGEVKEMVDNDDPGGGMDALLFLMTCIRDEAKNQGLSKGSKEEKNQYLSIYLAVSSILELASPLFISPLATSLAFVLKSICHSNLALQMVEPVVAGFRLVVKRNFAIG